MIIKAKSPLRIGFVGGGTDFPHWFDQNGGKVVSSTISKYAYCYLVPREDEQISIKSIDLNEELYGNITHTFDNDTVLKLATASINRFNFKKGFDLYIKSDAPPGSGLGGSSSIISAIIAAISEYAGVRLSLYEHAQLCYDIERLDLGIPGGYQDQYATTFGGFNYIQFEKDKVLVNPLRISQGTIDDLESLTMFCYIGKNRSNMENLIEYQISNYSDNKTSTEPSMDKLMECVDTFKEQLLYSNLKDLGDTLNEAFAAKKGVNPKITENTNVDMYLKTALDLGATGGKLCGAGQGGYLLILAPLHAQQNIRQKLTSYGCTFENIHYTHAGVTVWKSNIL